MGLSSGGRLKKGERKRERHSTWEEKKEDAKREKQGGKNVPGPRCQEDRETERGVEREGDRQGVVARWGRKGSKVLGVPAVGRGAGIRGNSLFLIIQTVPHPPYKRRDGPPYRALTALS